MDYKDYRILTHRKHELSSELTKLFDEINDCFYQIDKLERQFSYNDKKISKLKNKVLEIEKNLINQNQRKRKNG